MEEKIKRFVRQSGINCILVCCCKQNIRFVKGNIEEYSFVALAELDKFGFTEFLFTKWMTSERWAIPALGGKRSKEEIDRNYLILNVLKTKEMSWKKI